MRRFLFIALALLLGGGALWWGYSRFRTAEWRPALTSREIATRVLSERLAKQFPGAKVLVYGNPFTLKTGQAPEIYAFETASVRGLKQGFGPRTELTVVYPELRPEFLSRPESVTIDPRSKNPLSFLVAPDSFDQLLRANPGVDVVVSLIGLPVGVRQSQLWLDPDRPRLGLLLPDWRIIGPREEIRQAFKSGKIAAAIVVRPGGVSEDRPVEGKDYEVEFSRRFVLVTIDNIDELLRSYPRSF
jgi:hypothetical protein